MKIKLLSNVYDLYRELGYSVFFKFFILTVVSFPLFLLATHSSQIVIAGIDPTQDLKGSTVVVVSSGTTVVGLNNMHNARVVFLRSTAKAKAKAKIKAKSLAEEIKFATAEKKSKEVSAKKSANIDHPQKVDRVFNNSPTENSDFTQKTGSSFSAVFINYSQQQKAVISEDYWHDSQIVFFSKRLKFHRTLSYLQFYKLKNLSLRGPPILV